MSIKDRLYVATIGEDAVDAAREFQIGLEIDEYCTASNMDQLQFPKIDSLVRGKMEGISRFVMHAPFNELFPAAIDPLALELAYRRLEQSYQLTKTYGINRMVVHTGYVPYVYFKSWFLERSVEFWQNFMKNKPHNFHIMIENVLEDEPHTLAKLIQSIDDQRIRACLDVGHANCTTTLDLMEWVESLGPWLSHVHIHNNNKVYDNHWTLDEGAIDYNRILKGFQRYAPGNLTYTLENLTCRRSLDWLSENGWLE